MKRNGHFHRIGSEIYINENEKDANEPKRYVIEFTLLHTLRKRGIKQSELAKMAGITNNAVTNLVRNYRERVSLDHIAKIATALQITDLNEIMTIVEYEEAEFFNMYNSHHPNGDDE